jgi:hypothetical protein
MLDPNSGDDTMQSSTSDVQSLTARIEKLEKQNRIYKRVGLALLLLPAAVVAMGQARPNRTLEAQTFVVRDSTGTKRIELGMDDNSPMLRFSDAHGKTHIALVESDRSSLGPRIELSGEQDRVRLSLGLIREQPHIVVNDGQGFSAQLGSTPDLVDVRTGAASLILWDKDGKVLWLAPK